MRELILNDTEYAGYGKADQEIIDIRNMKLQGCLGCGTCISHRKHAGACVVADDMQLLYPKIAHCEKLTFICRHSFGCCSALCKCILDHMAILGYQEYTVKQKELSKTGWKIPLREIQFLLCNDAGQEEKALFQDWLAEVHRITAGTIMKVRYLCEETVV